MEEGIPVKKNALVTGGSRGIGKGIALALAKAGYDLAISHYLDEEGAEGTARQIADETGRRCCIFPGNLTESATASETVSRVVWEMGRISVLVNNAGICQFAAVQELTEDHLQLIMNLNFRAPLLMMREVSRHMIAEGVRGHIVNVTSSRAERAYPGDAVYGGLKAGLKRSSESAALDLAPFGIRVNCLAPGATQVRDFDQRKHHLDDKIPLGRRGLPADMGNAVVWLVSEKAAYITGIHLRVDGGLILPGLPE
ncbi:SDR family NAD(P)-dependent oxidoreductase [Cohnella hashimotonis]|uniref:SDR family oxidoreductase n=1 Tax=Cohnella hashimotonis TaxID=2826895 RepID=A0ABT6TKT0_9BACL|nr:SDR family oxidoreductase [Cohnella hashimotonis]MDI4647441.1 SDR family oxidoreductase [Cohnella hashimotonis]